MAQWKDRLNDFPLQVLLSFAEKEGIPIPDPVTKANLVNLLDQQSDETLRPLLTTPSRFEMDEVQLLSTRITDFEQHLTDISERLSERIDLRHRGIDQLKWLFSALGVAVALLLTIATALGIKQMMDISHVKDRYEGAIRNYERLTRNVRQTDESAVIAVIKNAFDTSYRIMATVDTAAYEEQEKELIRQQLLVLSELVTEAGRNSNNRDREVPTEQKALAGASEKREDRSDTIDEYEKMLLLLHEFYTALSEMPRIRDRDQAMYLAILDDVEEGFKSLAEIEFRSELMAGFARQLVSWKYNAIGVIEINRFLYTTEREHLKQAELAFGKASVHDKFFSRAYTNQAFVTKRYFNLERQKNEGNLPSHVDSLLEKLEEAQELLDKALKYHRYGSPSVALNNRAFYYLEKASLLFEVGRRSESLVALEKAKDWIELAEGLYPVESVVFTTKAEILIFDLKRLSDEEVGERFRTPDAREAKLEEILALLKRAGFTLYSGMTIEEVLAETPIYMSLEKLGLRGWKRRLAEALSLSGESV